MEDKTSAEAPIDQGPQPLSSKQRFLEAVGKEVPVDYFLFSALEHERLLRARPLHPDHDYRWPGAETSGDTPFAAAFQKLLAFYKAEYPDINIKGPFDTEQAVIAIPKLTGINRDMQKLHKQSGTDLPQYDKTAPAPVWADIEKALLEAFPSFGHLFVRYLQWAHGTEVIEKFEPGSRPPVGRYAPPMLRSAFGADRGRGRSGPGGRSGPPGRGGPGGRSGGDRGPRPPREDRPREDREPQEAAPREDREPSQARDDRGPRPDRGPRDDRGPRGGNDRGPRPRREGGDRGRDRGDRGGPSRRPNDEETSRLTEVALAEVDSAISMLKSDNALPDVTLKPTNSFYRRIQHQHAIDHGFTSNSVGEGSDRAVKVGRKD